jgi:hypothetical protein
MLKYINIIRGFGTKVKLQTGRTAILIMAQVFSVMGEGLGLLPNRALSASVRRPSANDDRFKMRIAAGGGAFRGPIQEYDPLSIQPHLALAAQPTLPSSRRTPMQSSVIGLD